VPFYSASKYYLAGLFQQELNFDAQGLSLMQVLPRALVKALPFALIGLGWLAARRQKAAALLLVPFYSGAAILLITYPTVAYDYSVPILLAFLPLFLAWAREVSAPVGAITISLFALFMVTASFSPQLLLVPIAHADVLLYALAGAGLVGLSLFNQKAQDV
jgi:hypothetical protein